MTWHDTCYVTQRCRATSSGQADNSSLPCSDVLDAPRDLGKRAFQAWLTQPAWRIFARLNRASLHRSDRTSRAVLTLWVFVQPSLLLQVRWYSSSRSCASWYCVFRRKTPLSTLNFRFTCISASTKNSLRPTFSVSHPHLLLQHISLLLETVLFLSTARPNHNGDSKSMTCPNPDGALLPRPIYKSAPSSRSTILQFLLDLPSSLQFFLPFFSCG